MLAKLVADGSITKEQADMATTIPIASSLIVGAAVEHMICVTLYLPLIKQMAGDVYGRGRRHRLSRGYGSSVCDGR